MYLLPGLNMKLRPQILSMRPGTRVVSHSFTMEDWEADEISTVDGRRAYFWVVPANVMGSWTLESNGQKTDLTLEQTFQKIIGTVALGAVHGGLRDPRLRGASISFVRRRRRRAARLHRARQRQQPHGRQLPRRQRLGRPLDGV